ncbi:hypothetical protein AAC387_Pa08g2161 [Persea americana]
MGLCTRLAIPLFLFLLLAAQCHGSSSTKKQVLSTKTRSGNFGSFLGFFPRARPIPPSGPSKKHNTIGLRSWRTP